MALPFPDISPNVFPPVGPFHVGGLSLGPFAVKWYALAYIAGLLLGWRYIVGLVKNAKLWGGRPATLTPAQIDDLVLWVTLGVIGGGRIGYLVFYDMSRAEDRTNLLHNPLEIFAVWHGGMSFHGAAIGVIVATLLFAWKNRVDAFRIGDLIVAAEPIGQGLGRIANFINGELWGRPTHLPWGMVFCNRYIAQENGGACPAEVLVARHPSQLYEAALEGLVLFLVLRWATHRAHWLQRRGAVTGLFLIGYGLIRIALENVRMPDEGLRDLPWGLTMGIILSVPMVLGGAGLLWWSLKSPLPPPPAHEPA